MLKLMPKVSPFYRRLNEIIAETFHIERQCEKCKSVRLVDHNKSWTDRNGQRVREVITHTITCGHCLDKTQTNIYKDWSTIIHTDTSTSGGTFAFGSTFASTTLAQQPQQQTTTLFGLDFLRKQ